MKIEKYVVILTAENGDKTHLKMNVNRDDKMVDVRLAEAIKADNAVLYIFGEEITKQVLEQSKIEYKVRIYAKDDINILLIAGGKAYGGGTGKAPKIKVLKALVDGLETEENQRKNEEKNMLEREQVSQEEKAQFMLENEAENQVVFEGEKELNFGCKNEGKFGRISNEKFEENSSQNNSEKMEEKCFVEGLNTSEKFDNFQEQNSSLSWAERAEKILANGDENNVAEHNSRGEKQEDGKVFAFDNIRFDGSNFYLSVKPQLDEIFVCYPEEEVLNGLVPNSRWVRINTPDGYYVVGLILDGDAVSYICYGVPSTDRNMPPAEIADFAVWLSLGGGEGRGYWLIYQDALTGKCLK